MCAFYTQSLPTQRITHLTQRLRMIQEDQNTRGTFSMDYRERGSHARSVYPTQDTSRVGTARVKEEEEEAATRIIVKE